MIGHRMMGISLMCTGAIAEERAHLDCAIALYDPAEHRPLATRFAVDVRMAVLSYRSRALWLLGYPEAALADTDHALNDAREIGQAATLMYALGHAPLTRFQCGKYATANAIFEELVALADEKGTLLWKALGMMNQGWLFALTGKASDAVHMITSGITALRSTGQHFGYHCSYHIWRGSMRNLANSMTLAAALAKQRRPWKHERKGGARRRSTA
jgi:tetratricopeptide (TPR) repeat protein